ncbi:MAG: bifunctional diaminohydroxyphosphoribosylaminopyrimidine deaminase/5-amino-6-(5-phosphoribosylamino)uracil reductase RibD [Candidatus Krumholzibacteriota bacterium]|nr:bifunctional diaminohydroxyphosphoribosylaminopyrimidine deaminase/5-amino-6-(5-phosphoribosylamino)uracil reductase RibD [Candidatus Krumholzibacteriota bacterium]
MHEEDIYISRALDLAEKGIGRTFPNPLVGAVIVQGGEIVGEGFHARAGGPHAEVEAILSAGEKARGSDLYLNLEPCCHFGKTPPCTDAILDAGISRVVCSIQDPDRRVSGKGIALLREKGIKVDTGTKADEALQLNLPYIHKAITGRPFIVLKLALSLDGGLNAADGRYLSSDRSRREVHHLRSWLESIAVGKGTFDADDPILDRRMFDESLSAPIRILFDSRFAFPAGHRWTDTPDRLLIYCLSGADRRKRSEFSARGLEVIELPEKDGMIDIGAWIEDISSREITSVLVEGGGMLATSMMNEGAVDRLILFHAPVLSGEDGKGWYRHNGVPDWFNRGKLRLLRLERFEDDIMAVYDREELGSYGDIVRGVES